MIKYCQAAVPSQGTLANSWTLAVPWSSSLHASCQLCMTENREMSIQGEFLSPWMLNQFWGILKYVCRGVTCTGKEGNSMDGESVWAEQAVVVHNLQTSFSEVYPHFHTVIVVIKAFKEWISALRA